MSALEKAAEDESIEVRNMMSYWMLWKKNPRGGVEV